MEAFKEIKVNFIIIPSNETVPIFVVVPPPEENVTEPEENATETGDNATEPESETPASEDGTPAPEDGGAVVSTDPADSGTTEEGSEPETSATEKPKEPVKKALKPKIAATSAVIAAAVNPWVEKISADEFAELAKRKPKPVFE